SMSWLQRLFRNDPTVGTEQLAMLASCRAQPAVPAAAPLTELRSVVVGVETSQLAPFPGRLTSVAAVEVVAGGDPLQSGFEVLFRQIEASARGNILVHGIGGTAQCSGEEPATAMLRFLNYAGRAPLIGFHADFDRIMIERTARAVIGW